MKHIARIFMSLILVTVVLIAAVSCTNDVPYTDTGITSADTDNTSDTSTTAVTDTETTTDTDTATGTTEETTAETPIVSDPCISYEFTGDEKDRPGYAEGTVTYTRENSETANSYSIFWANADGPLPDYYAVKTVSAPENSSNVVISIGENVLIPRGADRIAICNSEAPETVLAVAAIPKEKRLTDSNTVIFASVSDIHVNYTAGAKFWTNALNEYEESGVRYIVISGDVSEDGSQFSAYQRATEGSSYNGLIFASIGNHEQTAVGRENFIGGAIYDGSNKKWISLKGASEYFKTEYKGDLDVSVFYTEIEKNAPTCYYYATIGNSLYIFMDQMLSSIGNTPNQDSFSSSQINWLSNLLGEYSSDHEGDNSFKYNKYDIFIVEHALIKMFSSGDLYPGFYSQPIVMNDRFTNVMAFVKLLKEYPEAVWITGHTHMGFETSFDFIDKQFLPSGDPSGEEMARSVHNSSVSQPRWFEGTSVVYKNTFENGSEGYICYKTENDIIFEGHCFKEYTEGKTRYDASLFVNKVFPSATFIFPSFVKEHEHEHMHAPGKTVINEPTADTDGSLETYCIFCEELISTEVLPKLQVGKPSELSALSGVGSIDDPIIISNANDYKLLVSFIKDASKTLNVPQNMGIKARSGDPCHNLYFKQTADIVLSSADDIFLYSDTFSVFAGTYDGGGHSISIGTVTVTDATYSRLSVLPVVLGTVHSVSVDGSLRASGTTATVSVFQGIGEEATVKNCIFDLNAYYHTSTAPSCLSSYCGNGAKISNIFIYGSSNTRSGNKWDESLIENVGNSTDISNVFWSYTNGTIKSAAGVTNLSDSASLTDALDIVSNTKQANETAMTAKDGKAVFDK